MGDVDFYWKSHGGYLATHGVSKEHQAVEKRLRLLLRELQPASVLDVGCGRGRLALRLQEWVPQAEYSGLDLGAKQIKATRRVRPDGSFYQTRLQDFTPDRQWDLILSSEVLMHIPPADLPAVAEILKTAGQRLLLIEWVPDQRELRQPIAWWNWAHDYRALFGPPDYRERIYRQDIMLWTKP